MKFRTTILGAIAAFMLATPASAVLVSVAGPVSTGPSSGGGTAPLIIAAPGDVTDDMASNTGLEGFNEMIGFLLVAPLEVDMSIFIAAGTRVDSHMIFLNSASQGPGNNHLIDHGEVSWTFDGEILGIMTDPTGALEVASSFDLGAMGTTYPGAPFTARGLEGNDFAGFLAGSSVLTTSFRVTEPGDWIRVITVSQVPLPAALPLFAGGLGLMGLFARRKKHKALTT